MTIKIKSKYVPSLFLYAVILYLSPGMSFAQIVMDGSLGPAGALTGPDYSISGDLGQIRGANLFHSFESFNLAFGESAIFTGPDNIQNIISRVTGGEFSTIDGLVRSDIASANFYLINPAGVIFGPHANLDVSGSFHVSTADYLLLGGSGRFDATTPQNSILTVDPPSSFGFISGEPAPINFLGSGSADAHEWLPEVGLPNTGIEVTDGQTFSVIGGGIVITGSNLFYGTFGDWPVESRIYANGGRVNLVSVASAGEVVLTNSGVDIRSFSALGEIDINSGSIVSVSGDPAGDVYIRGGKLIIDGATVFSSSYGELDGGLIEIRLDKSFTIQNNGEISASSNYGGKASDIMLDAPHVRFEAGGKVSTASEYTAGAGNITIDTEDLAILGSQGAITGITSSANNEGKAGNVTISVDNSLSLTGIIDEAMYTRISTDAGMFSSGDAGDITIESPTMNMSGGVISSTTFGVGNSGRIAIETSTLTMDDDSAITNDSYSFAQGGTVLIEADESVSVIGNASSIQSNASGGGNAGSIEIDTPQLLIANGGWIQAASFSDGNAGSITLNVDRLDMSDGGMINSDVVFSFDWFGNIVPSAGHGGDITVNAAEDVSMVNTNSVPWIRTSITSSTFGTGDSGAVSITTPSLTINNSSIDVIAFNEGDAGSIILDVGTLSLENGGQISSESSFDSSGKGGDISVFAETILIDGVSPFNPDLSSRISVSAFGTGDGGTMSLEAKDISVNEGGIRSLTSGPGNAGSIDIEASTIQVSGGGQIDSTSREQGGQGGDITITGANSVTFAGLDSSKTYASGIYTSTYSENAAGNILINAPLLNVDQGRIRAETRAGGNAGNIYLNVDSLQINNGGQIDNGSRFLPDIPKENQEVVTGNGGQITIVAKDNTSISGEDEGFISGIFSNAESVGKGGNIEVTTGRLTLDDNGRISAVSTGTGEAGQISLAVSDILSSKNGFVTTQADNADGGDIFISAVNYIDLWDSEVTTSVSGGAGNGGNITIDPTFLILDNSKIIANAYGGNGGNIHITTDVFLATYDSIVDASSELGIDGEILIDAAITDVSGTVSTLPEDFLDISLMLGDDCFNRIKGDTSSLIVTSPGHLPLGPNDTLPISVRDISRAEDDSQQKKEEEDDK